MNLFIESLIFQIKFQLQSTILMADDIIDCSEMRRNKLCWYKVKNVESIAINDVMMIENSVYFILKKHFSHLPCYMNFVELFHETTLTTTIGQSLDFQVASHGVTAFKMNLHKSLSDYKTSHFGFYFPLALAILLNG